MDYPYVIVVNGKPETMFSPRDFEWLLERYMGHGAVVYFRRMTEDLAEENDELNRELERLLREEDAERERQELYE